MCGIITIIKKEDDGIPTHTSIVGMLATQAHRGVQGFGYLAFDDIVNSYVRREMRYEIERTLEKNESRSIMFHHRFPTSTPNLADCTHPIKVSHDELQFDYYLIHNGMISNDAVLRRKHLELGYEYITTVTSSITTKNHCKSQEKWNDSEALAIDVARFLEHKQEHMESSGSIAFVCAQVEKETGKVVKIFFGRNSSPLTVKITDKAIVIRSEGEAGIVEPNMLYTLTMKTFKLTKEKCKIGELISSRTNYHYDDSYYSMNDYNPMEDIRPSYSAKGVTDFLTNFGVDRKKITVINIEDSKVQEVVSTELLEELEIKMATLRDEICDLVDERRSLEEQGNQGDGSFEFEISEIQLQINEKKEKYERYQTDLELVESGQFDEAVIAH